MTTEQVASLVSSVDFTTVIVGLAGVGAAMMLPRITIAGIRMVKSLVS